MPEHAPTPSRPRRPRIGRRALGAAGALLLALPAGAHAQAAEVAAPDGAPPEAVAACPQLTSATGDVSLPAARAVVLCAINAERGAAGLPPLRVVSVLTAAAQDHTKIMVAAGELEHGNLAVQLRAYGRGSAFLVGENVGETSGAGATLADVVGAWMHSPGHRANILDPAFADIGIGVVLTGIDGGQGATVTTDFGARHPIATSRSTRRRSPAAVRRHRV